MDETPYFSADNLQILGGITSEILAEPTAKIFFDLCAKNPKYFNFQCWMKQTDVWMEASKKR